MSRSGRNKNKGPHSKNRKASSFQASNQTCQLNQAAQFEQAEKDKIENDSQLTEQYLEEAKIRNATLLAACKKQRLENLAREQAKPPPPKPKPLSPHYGPSGGFTQPKTDLADQIKASLKARKEQDPTLKPSTKNLPENYHFTKPRSPPSKIVVDLVYDYSGLESSFTPNPVQDTKTTAVSDGYLLEGLMDDINKFDIRGENHPKALPSSPESLEDADVEILQPPPKTSPAVIDLDCDDESSRQAWSTAANSTPDSDSPNEDIRNVPVMTTSTTSETKPESALEPSEKNLKNVEKKIAALGKKLVRQRKAIVIEESKLAELVKTKEAISRALMEKNRSTDTSPQLEKRKSGSHRSPGDEQQPKKIAKKKTGKITPPKPA